MADVQHNTMALTENHEIHHMEFTSATNRAAHDIQPSEQDKVAYQSDTNTYWVAADTGIGHDKWRQVSAEGTPDEARIAVCDANNIATFVDVDGDVTIAATGAVTIANNAVELAMMADNSVDTDQICDLAVDSDQIAANAIDLSHMSNNSVDSSEIVADAILNSKIEDDAVDSSSIVFAQDNQSGQLAYNSNVSIIMDRYTFFPNIYGEYAEEMFLMPYGANEADYVGRFDIRNTRVGGVVDYVARWDYIHTY